MTVYRRRMPKIEAVQLPIYDDDMSITKYLNQSKSIAKWCSGESHMMVNEDEYAFVGASVMGPYIQFFDRKARVWQMAKPGDYIVKDQDGDFTRYSKQYFEDNYIEVIA